MYMTRPMRVSAQRTQDVADGTVVRDGVRGGEDAAVGEGAVGQGDDARAVVRLGPVGVLYVVDSVTICLPL